MKFDELTAELLQLEPGQQLQKHYSDVADAIADTLKAPSGRRLMDGQFLMTWCRQNGVIVVMPRGGDSMIFLKKAIEQVTP